MDAYYAFNLLKGKWQLERIISDTGKVTGLAEFTQIKPDQLFYKENGVFTLNSNGKIFNVSREYFYLYKNDTIYIHFSANDQPGLLLHKLDFAAVDNTIFPLSATSQHACKHDTYSVAYTFLAEKILCKYNVKGPKKNYMIATQFSRI